MKNHKSKFKKLSKIISKFSPEIRGFYISVIACLVIFISLLLALPHLLPHELTPNQIRQQKAAQGLHVQGNKILNGLGQQVILHGVDRSGTEYQCVHDTGKIFDGPDDAASIQAMKDWKINAVRIPLNEDCWLGINEATPSGELYRQAITTYVDLINQHHMFAIVDLHWNAPGTDKATGQQDMADKDHALAFWDSVAQIFKNNPAIIFDLYNEPRNISWECWKNGMGCETEFPTVSMQEMIDTVRATGANNLLLLGGLDFSNNLSGWLANKPTDPINNLAASWHMYGKNKCDTKKCWDKTVAPVMAKVPVIAGEFGESYNDSVCGISTSNEFMNWMDQHQSGYLAWAWDVWSTKCSNLSLITNYDGTPKTPNGVNYKNHLKKF
jgi:hypothetical protein